MMALGEEGYGEASSPPADPKPYHSKRPHRKSRLGCKNCKTRKVKCDEARPSCRACTLRKEECKYPAPPPSSPTQSHHSTESNAIVLSSRQSPSSSTEDDVPPLVVVGEPLFKSPGSDDIDMRLLWFYTTETFGSFALEAGREPIIDDILKVQVVRHAFHSPFLMDCLLGLSALHLQYYDQKIPASRALAYRARAFEGYRKAIERGSPDDFPALLACSLLLCALSSQTFREPDAKKLYIIDWMIVWRGIGLIIDLITPEAMFKSGMAVLFHRPPLDLDQSALHIPNNLLFMVSSIKDGDPDFPHVETYYDTLKYLGSLYYELSKGFSPILDLRIIVFFTFLPKEFVELARQKRPRTLVIIAHYLTFIRLMKNGLWWMRDISDREVTSIYELLGEDWQSLLRVPLMALSVDNRAELAKLIMENDNWEPISIEKWQIERHDDTRTLSMVDDAGREVVWQADAPAGQRWVTRLAEREPAHWNAGIARFADMKIRKTEDIEPGDGV